MFLPSFVFFSGVISGFENRFKSDDIETAGNINYGDIGVDDPALDLKRPEITKVSENFSVISVDNIKFI